MAKPWARVEVARSVRVSFMVEEVSNEEDSTEIRSKDEE
jgi:hypothetical protein